MYTLDGILCSLVEIFLQGPLLDQGPVLAAVLW
jgi:hypothetical protein